MWISGISGGKRIYRYAPRNNQESEPSRAENLFLTLVFGKLPEKFPELSPRLCKQTLMH